MLARVDAYRDRREHGIAACRYSTVMPVVQTRDVSINSEARLFFVATRHHRAVRFPVAVEKFKCSISANVVVYGAFVSRGTWFAFHSS